MSTNNNAGRKELARFLRSRRERVSPSDVGLPLGTRRRISGLRREEVAVLAGVSTSWYTYLEQGREISPSPEVLDSLARVLRMSEDERRYMHVLAHGQVTKPGPLTPAPAARDMLRSTMTIFEHHHLPVYAGDHRGDLLEWNKAATTYYEDWSAYPPRERNIVRWMLLAPQAKARLADWEQDARDSVARWRAEAAKWPTDPRTRDLIAELARVSPEFTRWWDSHDVQEHRARVRRFRHPELGLRPLRILPLFSPEFPATAIIVHLPLNSDIADT
ncbi:helix-turn-helix transcriptional regulator [Actinokineospora auranticolor]|uniref:Helix-turn-helix protein n=1 Tax=Actinokineospora auranticolor TaxID=155976 RepID=A0A2S6GJQ1_9PSEU|nr:helix-turn-helix transcriptional regulator [Actinokineospora auranticolor]PPK65447.1 helix-turn-helix protein [Actinokineospora auranticolor]